MGIFKLKRKTFSIESGKSQSSSKLAGGLALVGGIGGGAVTAFAGPAAVGSVLGAGINAVRGKGISGTIGGFLIGGAITTLAGISIGTILGLREYIKLSHKEVVEGTSNKIFYDGCKSGKIEKVNLNLDLNIKSNQTPISQENFIKHTVVNQDVNKQSVTMTFNCTSSFKDLGSGIITLYKPSQKLLGILNQLLDDMTRSADSCGIGSYKSEKVDDGYIIQVVSSPKIFYNTVVSGLIKAGYLINYVY